MKEKILKIAESYVTKEPMLLKFDGCGNSIVMCMFEDYYKVAGMSHIMVPGQGKVYGDKPMRYSDKVVTYMVKRMKSKGAIKRRIDVKLVGGSVHFERFPEINENAEKIVTMVKKRLIKKGIGVGATDLGGSFGRNVSLNTETGEVTVENSKGEEKSL